MMKTNFKNNNKALSYAVFMMVGSYFNKCVCTNPETEYKHYLPYCEAGNKLQYELEEQAENYAVKKIFTDEFTEKDVCNQNVKVYFTESKDGSNVIFKNKNFILTITCNFIRRRCVFSHKLVLNNAKVIKAA